MLAIRNQPLLSMALSVLAVSCADPSRTEGRNSPEHEVDSGTEPGAQEREDSGLPFPIVPCGGRGKPLDELRVEGMEGLELHALESDPDPPSVGNNSWLVELAVQGKAATGKADGVTVTPFMPDHGHGSATTVGVTEEDPGRYRLEPIHTFMPGYWEIEVRLALDDWADSVTVGVCVE